MIQSTLTLFVPWVRTNYAHNTFTPNNPAIFTYSFYGTSDFHSFKNTFRIGDSLPHLRQIINYGALFGPYSSHTATFQL
jgi:hypothetical protein